MQRKRSAKAFKQNGPRNCPSGYKAEYGLLMIIVIFTLSNSEYNHQGRSQKRQSRLDILKYKSKTVLDVHRRLRRSTKRHEPQTRIWRHQCDRKPSGPWSAQLPVIFYCIPITFFTNSTEVISKNETTLSKRTTIFSPSPTNDFTTLRTPRNLDRALMNASLQFDVPVDVTDLRLWFQGIVSVEDNAFMGLKRLKLLGLQHNEISYLSRDAFAGINNLEQLDLSHNRLIAIHNTVFRHLRNLTTLSLRFNEIIFIQNSMFCGLDRISVLDISYNMIQDIDKYALQHFRSSYALTIDVTHNRLRTPKAEWLLLGTDSNNNISCKVESAARVINKLNMPKARVPQFNKNISGMEITIKKTGNTEIGEEDVDSTYSLPPVRLFRAANNPWSCVCNSDMRLVEFIRLYQSVFSAQINGADTVEHSSGVFRTDTKKVTNPKAYASWYFNMPCSEEEFQRIDLGRLSRVNHAQIEKTCCKELSESSLGSEIIAKDESLTYSCKKANGVGPGHFTDNHVTIIGIVIVFSTPILLTLCPDCNRTAAPSSRGNVVTASGKFGAVSLNANNNAAQWSDRQSKRKPFENERFCLVVQERTQDKKKVFKSETVF